MSHANEQASCLCCGKPGEPGAWLMDDQKVYVCRRCHRLGNTHEFKAASEEEGDAYAHGFFDGVDHDKEQRDELLAALENARMHIAWAAVYVATGLEPTEKECERMIAISKPDSYIGKISAAIASVKGNPLPLVDLTDGWIEWKGGDCPVEEGTPVEVRFQNGKPSNGSCAAEEWDWSHGDASGFDIIAYRVVEGGSA